MPQALRGFCCRWQEAYDREQRAKDLAELDRKAATKRCNPAGASCCANTKRRSITTSSTCSACLLNEVEGTLAVTQDGGTFCARDLAEAREVQQAIRLQQQAEAAAAEVRDFQRALQEARKQEAEARKLVSPVQALWHSRTSLFHWLHV